MRIVQETPELLLVRHRPAVAPLFCGVLLLSQIGVLFVQGAELPVWQASGAIALAVAMGAALVVSAVGTRARFDAQERRLRWQRTSPFPFGRDAVDVPLDSIVRVGVEELSPGADTGPTWRVLVATRSRSLPLTAGFANYGNHEALAETIRRWLRATGVALD